MSPVPTLAPLSPFGVVARFPAGTRFVDLGADQIHAWVQEHRVVVLRGLVPPSKRELPLWGQRLGPLLAWPFGSVNELRPDPEKRNYLYTNRAVPLHWDGAFVDEVPRYLFFHCVQVDPGDDPSPDGGETTFVDTTRLWAEASSEERAGWRALRFGYETAKVVHYGGSVERALVQPHPVTGEPTLRFAEPVDDLNPVWVRARGLDEAASRALVADLAARLNEPSRVLAHAWEQDDVVIADNDALLHGRRAFAGTARRHLRRVNVLHARSGLVASLHAALRIRRPEFWPAEIPIAVVPLLLLGGHRSLSPTQLGLLALLFAALFHVGDMVNCLVDRDLDAVYKTHLSEAVRTLGERHVRWQIGLTAVFALAVASALAVLLGRPLLVPLTVAGLLLGHQYSAGPLRLKTRGLWQMPALMAALFVGPMSLVIAAVGRWPSLAVVTTVLGYAAMQEGILLVNTAEDLAEDREAGLVTSALALGAPRIAPVALVCLLGGGALTTVALSRWAPSAALPLLLVVLAVAIDLVRLLARTWGRPPLAIEAEIKRAARRVPAWITGTAVATAVGAALATGG